MSVQIDTDFWKNYENHSGLLRKCFTHLYFKKYPVTEGSESAYNFLIAEFFRKGIFDRFDAEREGKYTQSADAAKTDDKKFEQYIYKWAESVMYGLYHNSRKNSERFLHFTNDSIEELNELSYDTFKKNKGVSSWETEADSKNVSKRSKLPCIVDEGDYHAERGDDAFEATQETELLSYLKSVLQNDREGLIVQYKMEGLNNVEVGECVGLSSSQVANILKGIKARCAGVLA